MIRNTAGRLSQYEFSLVPDAYIPRSRLHRPGGHTTTINSKYLYPLYLDEVLPGDTHKLNLSCVCRMTTLISPYMDNLFLDWHFFFVPNRLVWTHWVNMMGERENPDDSIDFAKPYIEMDETNATIPAGGLSDYFGLPVGKALAAHDVDSLWYRAYRLIWNEWFRNENLQNSVTVNKSDTADKISDVDSLLPRNKRKDYFTSCLPRPQKGDPLVVPVGESCPVVGSGVPFGLTDGSNVMGVKSNVTGSPSLLTTAYSGDVGDTVNGSIPSASQNKLLGVSEDADESGLIALLGDAKSVTINELRQAFQLQKLLERDQRGGTRYCELLRSHFSVVSPDARLQRPEFLGSCTVPINVHTVTQTSASVADGTPQGNLSAVAASSLGNKPVFRKSFTEHGMILGLCSVRSQQTYWQGVHRMFSRSTRYRTYWPALAHLGEQAVLNKEIWYDDAIGNSNEDVFGYQERWAEYKYGRKIVTGQMRPTAGNLTSWTLAQDFASLPTLNSQFIEEDPPVDRVLALQNEPEFLVDCLFDCVSVRPMPVYDVPGYVDHF